MTGDDPILAALADAPAGLTVAELAHRTGAFRLTTMSTLAALMRDGRVVLAGGRGRGERYALAEGQR